VEIEEPTFERYHDVPDRVRILVQVEADLHDNVIENLVNISKNGFPEFWILYKVRADIQIT
jgi:hypothetical protein